MHELLRKIADVFCWKRNGPALLAQSGMTGNEKRENFLAICAGAMPFYSAALIPTGRP
ncbi:MAG: hypothetical protein ACM3IH_03740 [Sphingobacteriales bacterium]|jgi:hypothetical protein